MLWGKKIVDLEDEFGCKICGNISKTKMCHNEHLHKAHSKEAILIASEIVKENMRSKIQTFFPKLFTKFHSCYYT